MRINIRGKRSLDEVRELLLHYVERLEKIGINHVTGMNLYFNPVDDEGVEIIITDSEGNPLEGWAVPAPKRTRKAKTAEVVRLAVNNGA